MPIPVALPDIRLIICFIQFTNAAYNILKWNNRPSLMSAIKMRKRNKNILYRKCCSRINSILTSRGNFECLVKFLAMMILSLLDNFCLLCFEKVGWVSQTDMYLESNATAKTSWWSSLAYILLLIAFQICWWCGPWNQEGTIYGKRAENLIHL